MTLAPLAAHAQAAVTATNGAFERVSLSDAVKRAMARNPNVETANLEVSRAHALLEEARSTVMPTLTANGTYTHLDEARTRTTGTTTTVISPQDSRSANLTLAVPVFAPGRWRGWYRAEDAILAATATAEDVRRTIALATGRTWLSVAANERLADAAARGVKDAQAHASYTATRLKGGLGNRLDDIRAQQQLRNATVQLENARTALAKAREALGVLVGGDAPLDVSTADIPEPPALEDALHDAVTKRADVRNLEIRRRLAKSLVNDAWTDYVPFVTAQAQELYQDPTSFVQTKQTSWQAQLLLTWQLYDGGLRYGVEREHRVQEREASVALEGAKRQAVSEVRGWDEAVQHADAALAAARDSAKLAHEQLDLANLAYQAGATTDLEVVDAERAALDADMNAAVAEDAARQARLELLGASGRFP